MKKIFNDYAIVMTTEDVFSEGDIIALTLYRRLKAKEKKITINRKVRFSKDAGDLYIIVDKKKYFCNEFKIAN